jgi:hypothetical protein
MIEIREREEGGLSCGKVLIRTNEGFEFIPLNLAISFHIFHCLYQLS